MNLRIEAPAEPIVMRWEPRVTDDEFYRFCADNPDLRLELTSDGELVIMQPAGTQTGRLNARLTSRLVVWAEQNGTGQAFDSSAGFKIPDGAILSPDASWILNTHWNQLTQEQQRRFAPVCPDFVVELRSPSDRLSIAKAKMQQWIDNGAQLGWLLDPDNHTVYIYRPGREAEQLIGPERLIGETPVAGFVLELSDILY